MSFIIEGMSRNVIPRWRDFATTLDLGELNTATSTREQVTQKLTHSLVNLEEDWNQNRSLSFAGDLISAAIHSKSTALVLEAAEFVLDTQRESKPDDPLTKLALRALNETSVAAPNQVVQVLDEDQHLASRIADYRRQLASWPRDAILWVDLALLYARKGILNKAEKAMTVALNLEPANRFVLRSAARFFIHLNELDRAHSLLRRSSTAKTDPWIVAAEIATATSIRRFSYSIDAGIRLLASSSFDPKDLSELATAVATLQLRDGSTSKAKKYARQGLIKPNENSLAQAKWLAQEIRGLFIRTSVTDFHVQRSFEASAWEAYANGQWNTAVAEGVSWLRDQPFSSRPAIISTHMAGALLEDYDAAERLAKMGLTANPNDAKLRMLLAFMYGSTGRTKEAGEQLSIAKPTLSDLDQITYLGNLGLIAFRDLDVIKGRSLYSQAAELAKEKNESVYVAAALTYWAREEVQLQTPLASSVLARASEATKSLGPSHVEAKFVFDRLEKRFRAREVSTT